MVQYDTYDRRVQLGASRHRRKDAEFLQQSARWNGAIYLAGYAIECSLKALICYGEHEDREQTQSTLKQMPLWSEILLAPDPVEPATIKEDKRPFVVTFYSLKGGVGRSTSLALVANILTTRGHRVVMIDFDLEAPGLSFAHPPDASESSTYGVLDYIYQRYLTTDQDEPKIDACIRQINIPARGELYLIPAGEYNEDYVHRLADLNIQSLYQSNDTIRPTLI